MSTHPPPSFFLAAALLTSFLPRPTLAVPEISQGGDTLVVLRFQGNAPLDVRMEMADQTRTAAARAMKAWNVPPITELSALLMALGENHDDCQDERCLLANLQRLVQVQAVIHGEVMHVDNTFYVNLTLYKMNPVTKVGTVNLQNCDKDSLRSDLDKAADKMVMQGLAADGRRPPEPARVDHDSKPSPSTSPADRTAVLITKRDPKQKEFAPAPDAVVEEWVRSMKTAGLPVVKAGTLPPDLDESVFGSMGMVTDADASRLMHRWGVNGLVVVTVVETSTAERTGNTMFIFATTRVYSSKQVGVVTELRHRESIRCKNPLQPDEEYKARYREKVLAPCASRLAAQTDLARPRKLEPGHKP